jgi:hypothetical protein
MIRFKEYPLWMVVMILGILLLDAGIIYELIAIARESNSDKAVLYFIFYYPVLLILHIITAIVFGMLKKKELFKVFISIAILLIVLTPLFLSQL